ncbi:MAG: discoidin domain-containing protein [Planctomycetes bacterium]|nr:discoidin domain-containing protein [Planctomycetota bacterium]
MSNGRRIPWTVLALTLEVAVLGEIRAEVVGWWKCDEGSGTVARDASRYGNDLSVQGNPQWVTGHCNGGLEFDGAGDYLERGGYAPSLDIVGGLTVTAWVRTGAVRRDHKICGNITAGPNGGGYLMGIYSNDRVELEVWSSAGTSAPPNRPGGGTVLQKGTWYFLAATYTATAEGGIIRTYVNGAFDREQATTIVLAPSRETFKIGRDPQAPGSGEFTGILDDVRVYNHVLAESELREVMLGRRPKSRMAVAPVPEDEQMDVSRDTLLAWTSGDFARKHDVYLGTTFADVNSAGRRQPLDVLVSQDQEANTYALPEPLDYGRTYFWRVDEVNAPPDATIHRGDVWSFTTETILYAIPADKIVATASSSDGVGPEKTIDGSGLVQDLHSIDTKAMWLSKAGDPGSAWIRYDFDRAYKVQQLQVWNYNGPLLLSGFGVKDATIEYSMDGATWIALAGTNVFARASGKDGYGCNTTVDLGGIMAQSIRITARSNWGGSFFRQYGLSEVRCLSTPVHARYPNPDSGTVGVPVDVTLGWRAGREAARHDLYLGMEKQAVKDGAAPVVAVTQASHGPLSLAVDQTYYWKVDEVNSAGTPTKVEGDVWSFSTVKYPGVDASESYTDDEGGRVYETWIDGWEVPANGSQVGYSQAPFAEQTIVHGGGQSMPLSYDNTGTATYSETTRTFADGQNWTQAGVNTLVLYFHGEPNNTGQLYAKVNGAKVVYSGTAANLAEPQWTPWDIDLVALGLDLKKITALSIGIDGVGAKGTLYIDDIRLSRAAKAN